MSIDVLSFYTVSGLKVNVRDQPECQGCQTIFTKKPVNLLGGALCHKLTIYKQFSTYKFINT